MRLFLRLAAAALSLTTFAQAQAPGKRPITEKDLFSFVWIGDTQLAPDGHTVAFVQTTVTPDHSGYQTSLYTLDTAAVGATPQRLTDGTHDQSPRWSPDGKQLAFVRAAEREGKPTPPQVYLIGTAGSKDAPATSPIRITDLPKGAGNPQWSPDGQSLLVTSSTPQDPAAARRDAALKARSTGDAAHVSDVRIITRPTYRFNGEGYLDPSFVPQIYLIALPTGDTQAAPMQLTGGRDGVQEAIWSGSGTILYTRGEPSEPKPGIFPTNHLFTLDVLAAGTAKPGTLPAEKHLADLPVEAHGLALSPDGKSLAFHGEANPQPPAKPVSHQESDLWVMSLASPNAAPKNLTGGKGFEMGSGVGGDNTAPRGGGRTAILWSGDSTHLLDIAGSQGSALLLSVDAQSGDITRLSARKQAVLSFVATPAAKSIVALISNPILIGDLFRIDPSAEPGGPHAGGGPPNPPNQTQLTHVNDALFSQLDLSMPQDLHVKPTVRPDDIPFLTIDTFVQLPPDFPMSGPMDGDKPAKPAKPYPAILNIHGGPHSAYGWVFDHEMLWMAAKGYIVIYPNPRGSTTYGERFANVIESNYPGDDFHDLMDTVDAVVAKGWADPARLGVTGGSGGGLLTDWTVTQTTRFKAAVAQRDIVDQAAWWYTADIGEFHQYWMPEAPFDHLDVYKAHSPLTFVNNVKTPMMFILGDADYRTPPTSGGEEFFRYLKYRGIPTAMVRFPRESHELSRSGEPWHRIERLENIVNWFDFYLDGICQPQYDDLPPCSSKP